MIANPAARGERASRFFEHLDALAVGCTFKPTAARGDARSLAAEAVGEGFDTIVAAGGDGTVNEVVNGIADAPGGLERTRLAVLPLGTANVFAKELGLPRSWRRAWRVVAAGRERAIDVAVADFRSDAGERCRRCFVQMAGAGWDSAAIELVDRERKKRLGWLAYVVAGLEALRGELPDVTVRDGTRSVTGKQVLIGNGRYYGGRYRLFPRADMSDGLLEVVVFPRIDWPTVVRFGLGLATGRLHRWTGAVQFRAERVELESAGEPMLEVEGENVGRLPAEIVVEPRRLRVVVP